MTSIQVIYSPKQGEVLQGLIVLIYKILMCEDIHISDTRQEIKSPSLDMSKKIQLQFFGGKWIGLKA